MLIELVVRHRYKGLKQVLAAINRIEIKMGLIEDKVTELVAAVGDLSTRVVEDVQSLRDIISQALATETANAAEIARLNAEADAAVTSINDAIAAVQGIDPVPEFPPVEPPVEPTP